MKLSGTSLEWALTHLQRENDTDLFPEPIEIEIVNQQKEGIVRLLKVVDLGAYSWHPSRRFMVPKGELSYRMIHTRPAEQQGPGSHVHRTFQIQRVLSDHRIKYESGSYRRCCGYVPNRI